MPPEPFRQIEVEPVGDVTVVRFLQNRIVDPDVIRTLGDELLQLVDKEGHRRLLLNFQATRYVSSGVIGKLVTLKRRIDSAGGQLKVSNFHPDFIQIFKTLRLEDMFSIFPDEASALAAFKKG